AKRNLAKFRGRSRAEWRGWLRVILQHVLDARQRRLANGNGAFGGDASGRGRPDPIDPGPTPQREAIRWERMRVLHQALEQLSDGYRQVIVLHHVDKLSFEEIARRLSKPSADA